MIYTFEAKLKIISKNVKKLLEKIDERTNLGPILNGPFLLNLCHSNSFLLICSCSGLKILKNFETGFGDNS